MCCSWTHTNIPPNHFSFCSCIWNLTGCNSRRGSMSSTKMFHTVTLFTVIIPFVFLPFYFDGGGGMRDSHGIPLECRHQEGVEVNGEIISKKWASETFPFRDFQAKCSAERSLCLHQKVPGFRWPKVVFGCSLPLLGRGKYKQSVIHSMLTWML